VTAAAAEAAAVAAAEMNYRRSRVTTATRCCSCSRNRLCAEQQCTKRSKLNGNDVYDHHLKHLDIFDDSSTGGPLYTSTPCVGRMGRDGRRRLRGRREDDARNLGDG